MSFNDHKIQALPPEVVAKIKSSTSITHLNGVIVELVKNSLDANACTVFVTVDFQRGGCVVEDDGDGIPPAEFAPGGGLGKAHHTSKFHLDEQVCGRRGLFLASLSSLSLLTVTSHHFRHQSTNSIVFHHSIPVARLIPAPVQQGLRFSSHGTNVTVNDLFGNMPVRVKSRALALQKPDEMERQWDDLKQLLVSLAIANDNFTKLVLSDSNRDRKLTIRSRSRNQGAGGELDLQRIGSIFAQAGFIEAKSLDLWEAVSACVPDFSIHAAISLVPSPTKKGQFISVGMDPVYARNSTNLLYSEINRLFATSDFGAVGAASASLPAVGASSTEHIDSQGIASPKFVPKAVNKWPMFYIRINTSDPQNLQDDSHEILPESDKSIQRIIDVLAAMITEFLKQHGLRPRAGKRKRNPSQMFERAEKSDVSKPRVSRLDHLEAQVSSTEETLDGHLKLPSFQRSTRMSISQDFRNWSRIKSAKEPLLSAHLPDSGQRKPESGHPLGSVGEKSATSRVPAQGSLPLSGDSVNYELSQGLGMDRESAESEDKNESDVDTMIPWTDPHTGKVHLINSRTGQSINFRSPMAATFAAERPRSTGSLQKMRVLENIRRPRSAIPSKTQNTWVENLLKKWNNPTFCRPEKPINAINNEEGHQNAIGRLEIGTHGTWDELCGSEIFGLSKFRGKLRKQDLETAEIIAQVDQKFILAKFSGDHDSGSVLVLIDQHAADERCRVEELFEELFSSLARRIQTITIDPIIFEIPATEVSLFGRYMDFFTFWGVEYKVEQNPEGRAATVFVYSLPTLIAERCRVEPKLVTDLIRGEIWKREESAGGFLVPKAQRSRDLSMGLEEPRSENRDSWVERLNGCPQGIIDLLNSRACRTAIMFNDALTPDECRILVSRLAKCLFPFQCAHGRPSMIPILDMHTTGKDDAALDGSLESEYEGLGFVEAFKAWSMVDQTF